MTINRHSKAPQDIQSSRKTEIYKGKRKILFEGQDPYNYILHYTDETPCGTLIPGKGAINSRISAMLFSQMSQLGIPNHFIKNLNMREQLVRAADPLPIRIRVYNSINDDLHSRFQIQKGRILSRPLFEFLFKKTNQVISREHIMSFGLANDLELEDMTFIVQRIGDFLFGFFGAFRLRLASFFIEFGRIDLGDYNEQMEIIVLDELSLDTLEFCDDSHSSSAPEKLGLFEHYQFFAEKLGLKSAFTPPTHFET